ncbi:nuclear transport factor 2 family protein [Streptomyces sp. NBC_01498]|uniref:nuclear transport factor 2 family protein n=1 Tax=Streptomyces sp. NBC_01498 TaxID=2975870 RepID=UPI002E7B13B1|nr:nuclear transport factor 2 family protein [Streptomyces sp. NBC_01498]WTL23410.1 nuclear transport factor 2 family protein [Streptomyces sp. NBC_01498]
MSGLFPRRSPRSTAATAAGIDHVRLSYHYRDTGDIDAFGSLLHEDVQVKRPDAPFGHGRDEVIRLHTRMAGAREHHHIYKIVADGDCVVVTGSYTGACAGAGGDGGPDGGPAGPLEFADVFTLTDDGMLLGYRRFYFVAPN